MRGGVQQLVNHHVIAVKGNALFLLGGRLAEGQQILREANNLPAILRVSIRVANQLAAVLQNKIRLAIALANAGFLGQIGDGTLRLCGIVNHQVQPIAVIVLPAGESRHARLQIFECARLQIGQRNLAAAFKRAELQRLHGRR